MKGTVPIAWEQSCVPLTGRITKIAFYIHKRGFNGFADNCGKNISWQNKIYWFLSLDPRFWFEYLLSGWKSYPDFRETVPRLLVKKKSQRTVNPAFRKAKSASEACQAGLDYEPSLIFLCKVTSQVLNTAHER